MHSGDQLYRSWRNGNLGASAFLADYSALICGLLELYQLDFDERWFDAAERLADDMIGRFEDPNGGFFDTGIGTEALLFRPKDLQDNATPSGNALACEAFLRLAALTNRGDYRDYAERALRIVAEAILRFPTAFGEWLSAASFALGEVKQIAIVYQGGRGNAQELLRVVNQSYRPNTVLAGSEYPPSDKAPTLLKDRTLKDGEATAYVCKHFVCRLPVNSPEDLRKELSSCENERLS